MFLQLDEVGVYAAGFPIWTLKVGTEASDKRTVFLYISKGKAST